MESATEIKPPTVLIYNR